MHLDFICLATYRFPLIIKILFLSYALCCTDSSVGCYWFLCFHAIINGRKKGQRRHPLDEARSGQGRRPSRLPHDQRCRVAPLPVLGPRGADAVPSEPAWEPVQLPLPSQGTGSHPRSRTPCEGGNRSPSRRPPGDRPGPPQCRGTCGQSVGAPASKRALPMCQRCPVLLNPPAQVQTREKAPVATNKPRSHDVKCTVGHSPPWGFYTVLI